MALPRGSARPRARWVGWLIAAIALFFAFAGSASPAHAASSPTTLPTAPLPTIPSTVTTLPTPTTAASPVPAPTAPPAPNGGSSGQITVNVGSATKPSESVLIIVGITLLSVAPALLMMLTSFTRVIIVLSRTRQAMGLQNVPPNQVLVGLALFISLFIMGPTINQINTQAVQPYLHGKISQGVAYKDAQVPLKAWMVKQTRTSELAVFENASPGPKPKSPNDVGMSTLVPAFILSEIKSAFIIGFVIFIPFLVIDIIVSSSLMSMGMMMLPPVLVSLPFKILLFVLVDGWGLVVKSLITSYRT